MRCRLCVLLPVVCVPCVEWCCYAGCSRDMGHLSWMGGDMHSCLPLCC